MKVLKHAKESIQKKMMKKTIDGIALILLRMYDADQKTDTPSPDFVQFVHHVINMTPEGFYSLPITPADKFDVMRLLNDRFYFKHT